MATGPNSDRSDGSTASERHHDLVDTTRHQGSGTNDLSDRFIEPSTALNFPRRRSSAFFEAGLEGHDVFLDAKVRRNNRPKLQVRFRSKVDVHEPDAVESKPEPCQQAEAMPPYFPTLPRLLFLVFCIALIIPSLGNSPLLSAGITPIGAKAGPVGVRVESPYKSLPEKRQDTSVCKRWSQQSAMVNGTLYLYGGRLTTSADQTADTWNDDFLTIDLKKTWQITTPTMTSLAQPSGPPAISLGTLWNSYDALYLYGGEFSDNPITSPVPFSTWSYDISSKSWSEHTSPVTTSGEHSGPANEAVQRAAEGAGTTVPHLGRGFYFGGHLDGYTTEGWSQSIARVYLTSLLEYTFPGYSNPTINSGNAAGADGLYRNITEGGTQDTSGFPERADGVLVYIPGYGDSGIILGLAGGTNQSFTQMNIIDVYDVASSTWYKQATSGPTPEIRVNPCAVAVSAADGSSTNVYMYGGQNLIPYGEQKQYSDMWILTVPSFTWIQVDTSTQSVPPARAGHTCNIWNSQMVVVGGYVGQDLSCDSGIYVFNTSSLSWQNSYYALEGGTDDPLNRQKSQQKDVAALQGSYGYIVPEKVQSVVGGNGVGAATVTAPAQSAAQGPMATGSAITYTVTAPDGSVATETSAPTTTTGGSENSSGTSGPNKGAIIAGVLAGFFAVLAAYLGFCAWVYRKQLRIYKNHVTMAQRQALAGEGRGFLGVPIGGKYFDKDKSLSSSEQRTSDDRSAKNSSRGGTTGNRAAPLNSNNPYNKVPGGAGSATAASSTEDLLQGQEPSFLGVVLNPRRSLRVVNRD